jgi:hypothetical protein
LKILIHMNIHSENTQECRCLSILDSPIGVKAMCRHARKSPQRKGLRTTAVMKGSWSAATQHFSRLVGTSTRTSKSSVRLSVGITKHNLLALLPILIICGWDYLCSYFCSVCLIFVLEAEAVSSYLFYDGEQFWLRVVLNWIIRYYYNTLIFVLEAEAYLIELLAFTFNTEMW